MAERPDGQQVSFSSSSGIFTPDSDVDLKLTRSGSTWTLTDQNDTSEIYFTSGSEGVLQSITQRNGYTQALTYSHGQIAFVSDSYARTLTLGYSSGLLSTVSTPEFTSGLTFSYVAFISAGTHLLSTVTYATSPATHQTYLYENANYPYALTGITDENGNRYATWGYDNNGRGILSQLAGGSELHERLLQRHDRQPRRQRPAWHRRTPTNSRPCRASRKSPRLTAPPIPPWRPQPKPSAMTPTATATA